MRARALVSWLVAAAACLGALSGGLRQLAAPPQALEARFVLSPSEIEIYKNAETLIDWAPRQIHHCPYLRKLQPAASQAQLPKILERVGQTVSLMMQDFPRIACDEVIAETRPGHGQVEFMGDTPMTQPSDSTDTQKIKARYIVVPSPVGELPAFEEYRTKPDGTPLNASSLPGFIVTASKYASTCLYFSPADQHDSRFRLFGTQMVRDRECQVVGFAQDPEKARRIDRFHAYGATFGLLFQGLAWIDPENSHILRITTWLLAPRKQIGISSQSTTVDYYPVQPAGSQQVLWLPRDVTVLLVFGDTHVRNIHHYSDFKLFRVESTIKPGG